MFDLFLAPAFPNVPEDLASLKDEDLFLPHSVPSVSPRYAESLSRYVATLLHSLNEQMRSLLLLLKKAPAKSFISLYGLKGLTGLYLDHGYMFTTLHIEDDYLLSYYHGMSTNPWLDGSCREDNEQGPLHPVLPLSCLQVIHNNDGMFGGQRRNLTRRIILHFLLCIWIKREIRVWVRSWRYLFFSFLESSRKQFNPFSILPRRNSPQNLL